MLPRWESRIGASVDGLVIDPQLLTRSWPAGVNLASLEIDPQPLLSIYSLPELVNMAEGILEIKSPVRMYRPLTNYIASQQLKQEQGITTIPPQTASTNPDIHRQFFSHIWQTHFDQMQQGMAVLRKSWCDYVVYTPKQMFCQRIPYCHQYYLQQLLGPIRFFLDSRIDPFLPVGRRWPLPDPSTFAGERQNIEYTIPNLTT